MRSNIIKNRNFNFVAGLILSVSFLVNVSAQSKTITKEELEIVKSNAAKKLDNVIYRSVTSEKHGTNEKKTVYEFVPPDREHFIINGYTFSTDSSEAAVISTFSEWIYIGKKIYYRNEPNKNWKEFVSNPFEGYGTGRGSGYTSEEPKITTEYKLTPNQTVNQQKADFYEMIVNYKYSWNPKPSVEIYNYWINKKGLFVKTRFVGTVSETTIDYEYNSKIKIQAPVIKKRSK